jgi:hypothetical protein
MYNTKRNYNMHGHIKRTRGKKGSQLIIQIKKDSEAYIGA